MILLLFLVAITVYTAWHSFENPKAWLYRIATIGFFFCYVVVVQFYFRITL
jgi:hypothetical protein